MKQQENFSNNIKLLILYIDFLWETSRYPFLLASERNYIWQRRGISFGVDNSRIVQIGLEEPKAKVKFTKQRLRFESYNVTNLFFCILIKVPRKQMLLQRFKENISNCFLHYFDRDEKLEKIWSVNDY